MADIHVKLLTPLDFHAGLDFHRDHLSTQLPPPTQPSLTEASIYKARFKSSVYGSFFYGILPSFPSLNISSMQLAVTST